MIEIQQVPDPYSQERRFVVVWGGFTHLAYGITEEEAVMNFYRIWL